MPSLEASAPALRTRETCQSKNAYSIVGYIVMAEFREEPSDNEIDSSKKSKSTVHPGIIYLSRIPPYMKPLKIRHIFSDFGEIGRVFLQPEGMAVLEIGII